MFLRPVQLFTPFVSNASDSGKDLLILDKSRLSNKGLIQATVDAYVESLKTANDRGSRKIIWTHS